MKKIVEYAVTITIALILVYFINTFVIMSATVQQTSMLPNFEPNDRVLVRKFGMSMIKQKDVIIVEDPEEEGTLLIKRLYGMPGDHLVIKDGNLYVNNKRILKDKFSTEAKEDINLKSNEYYVIGDNFDNSKDSRIFGPVKKDNVVGEVVLKFWPLDSFEII